MSLQAILDAIQAAGEQQVSEIEANARKQADSLMLQARADARRLREETRRSTLAPASGECLRIRQQAQFDALRLVTEARERLIDTVLGYARERLIEVRSDPSYPALLSGLIREALADLRRSLQESEVAVLEADPRDRAILERLLADVTPVPQVSYPLACWGGVIARSADGRIVVTNTLETRLERAMPYLRRYLASQLECESPEAAISRVAAYPGA
jgi:V/A-type H+-transporting ATPase subunit E